MRTWSVRCDLSQSFRWWRRSARTTRTRRGDAGRSARSHETASRRFASDEPSTTSTTLRASATVSGVTPSLHTATIRQLFAGIFPKIIGRGVGVLHRLPVAAGQPPTTSGCPVQSSSSSWGTGGPPPGASSALGRGTQSEPIPTGCGSSLLRPRRMQRAIH